MDEKENEKSTTLSCERIYAPLRERTQHNDDDVQ
jgi:hypothetical protein